MKIDANLPMEFKNSGQKIPAAIATSIAQEDARSSFRSINANSDNDAISCMIIERSQKLYNKITQQLGPLFV
mgnify:FL=1